MTKLDQILSRKKIIYKDIYLWFKYRLSVNSPDKPVTNFSFINDSIDEIGNMLSMFGTGISEFHLVEVPIEKVVSNIPKDLLKDISEHLLELKKSSNFVGAMGMMYPMDNRIVM